MSCRPIPPTVLAFALLLSLPVPQLLAQRSVQATAVDRALPLLRIDGMPTETDGTVRLVHAITGLPVAGGELFAIVEERHPLPGALRFAHRAVADQDGFATLPDAKAWLMARGSGLGPTMEMTPDFPLMLLAPAVDVPIRPLDWLGRPMPGATLGFCGGCGHTPDLTTATVGRDGIAWLSGVDPRGSNADIYPNDAPVSFDYGNTHWVPGDAPEPHHYRRGVVLHGRVLLPDGSPAAGALVGTFFLHRGPWTITDQEGSFRLSGLDEGDDFFVVHGDRQVECPWPAKMPCELRLPEPDGRPVQQLLPDAPRQAPADDEPQVVVEFVDPKGMAIDAVSWWRRAGRRERLTAGSNNWLSPGLYEVRVEHPAHGIAMQSIEVGTASPQTFRFELQPLPTVRIAVRGLPPDGEVRVVRREQTTEAIPPPDEPLVVPLRDDEDFAVELRHPGTLASRWFQWHGGDALARRMLVCRWWPPTRVQATLVDGRGLPVAADVALLPRTVVFDDETGFDLRTTKGLQPAVDGNVALESEQDRLCFLCIRPRDEALRPRLVAVPMPERGDAARVELGRIVLGPTPQLVLHDAAGMPRSNALARLLRAGYGDFRNDNLPLFPCDERGGWLGPDLVPGDGILVPATAAGELPLRHVVTSTEPVVVSTPSGRLRLRVMDETRAALRATVLLRECLWPCDGELQLTQLPRGPLVLFVAAAGHRGARLEITDAAAVAQPIEVVLTPR